MMLMLEVIRSAGRSAAIKDIVSATRLPRSTVYRMLNTLMDHGVVVRTEHGSFGLGYRLLSLAAGINPVIPREELVRVVHPTLVALAEETRETCKLSLLGDDSVEVIDVVQSPDPIAPSSRVGSRFPPHVSAAGKILLAMAGPDIRARFLEAPLQAFSARTITDARALEAELQRAAADRVAFDRGEWNETIRAIGMPILDHRGAAVGAISITYFATRSGDQEEALVERLRAAVGDVSHALGYRPGAGGLPLPGPWGP